jgi:hypothetical protein
MLGRRDVHAFGDRCPGRPRCGGRARTRSCLARNCPVRSCPAWSCPVRSRPARSCPVRSRPARSCPVRSRPARSCPARSRPVPSRPVRSCPVRSCPARSCPARSRPVPSRPVRSRRALSCAARSRPARSRRVRSRPVRTCRAWTCRAWTCRAWGCRTRTCRAWGCRAWSRTRLRRLAGVPRRPVLGRRGRQQPQQFRGVRRGNVEPARRILGQASGHRARCGRPGPRRRGRSGVPVRAGPAERGAEHPGVPVGTARRVPPARADHRDARRAGGHQDSQGHQPERQTADRCCTHQSSSRSRDSRDRAEVRHGCIRPKQMR